MRIEYSRLAIKTLSLMDKPTKQRIRRAIDGLLETPPKGDIRQMQGYDGTYRLRVGKYRIIYRYDYDLSKHSILFISDIGSRGDIYK